MSDLLVLFSLVLSAASAILAVIAIWIALYGKAEADKTNQKTQELLTEIRSDARSISQVAMPELKAYGDWMRRFILEEGGTKPSSGAERIEKSVNEAMGKIMHELGEVKAMPDLNTAFDRLAKVEAQVERSKETIEESVREDLAQKLAESRVLAKTMREWKDQFSQGDLSGIQSIFGPYGIENEQLKFQGGEPTMVVLQGFWGRNVRVDINFEFINPEKGKQEDWLGVWARGRNPYFWDGNLVYVRKDGRTHIYCNERRDLQTASEKIDPTKPVDLSAEYRDRLVRVWVNELEFATDKED